MTKETGQVVLDKMVETEILSLHDAFYYLDPDQLAAQTGLSYADCVARRFGEKAVQFVKSAIRAGD